MNHDTPNSSSFSYLQNFWISDIKNQVNDQELTKGVEESENAVLEHKNLMGDIAANQER